MHGLILDLSSFSMPGFVRAVELSHKVMSLREMYTKMIPNAFFASQDVKLGKSEVAGQRSLHSITPTFTTKKATEDGAAKL